MAFLVVTGNDTVDMVTYIGLKTAEYYRNAQSGTKPAKEKKNYKILADELHKYSQALMLEAIAENTAKFQKVKSELDTINTDLKAKLDALEQAAQTIENIATVLKLVDQGIQIAAGVMK